MYEAVASAVTATAAVAGVAAVAAVAAVTAVTAVAAIAAIAVAKIYILSIKMVFEFLFNNRFVEELSWDINLIDKLHYIATPVIFLSLTIIMRITVAASPSGDSMTFTCWTPAQFTHEMAEYAKNACRYGQGSLYTVGARSEADSLKDSGNVTTYVSKIKY